MKMLLAVSNQFVEPPTGQYYAGLYLKSHLVSKKKSSTFK